MANDHLVDRRIETQVAIYGGRIERATATLEQVVRNRRDQNLQRLHRGRIHNLEHKREEAVEKLERGRGLAVTLQPVAVAVMSG